MSYTALTTTINCLGSNSDYVINHEEKFETPIKHRAYLNKLRDIVCFWIRFLSIIHCPIPQKHKMLITVYQNSSWMLLRITKITLKLYGAIQCYE